MRPHKCQPCGIFLREMGIFSIRPISRLYVRDSWWNSWRKSLFERLFVMSKSILFALLAATGSSLNAGDVFACGGRCGTSYAAPSCAAPACTAPANGAPTDPQAGVKMSQSNTSRTYQSFSYEPGTSQPMMSNPVQNVGPAYRSYRQPSSSFFDSIRGDKKVRAAAGIQ